ncbi:anti-repressor SinI family protein [Halobacillus andaensis]|uniref:anti-repressor SinI family protein n=1 Tax=Halobacillus andaensis TaxID=1176239 RepID=UPI003D71B249
MESLKRQQIEKLDAEWMELMRLAKVLGFSVKEVKEFIVSHPKKGERSRTQES